MSVLNPTATFDALFLIARADVPGGLFDSEIQMFSYLSCLLSLFDGKPASDWGYDFVAVPPLQPFSPDIDIAIKGLASGGLVFSSDAGWLISTIGLDELKLWQTLSTLENRGRWLSPAVGSIAFHSVASISDRLAREPSLAVATKLGSTRELLEAAALGPLYEQFAALREVVGPAASELLIPADVYLRFLVGRSETGSGDVNEDLHDQ